MSFDDDEKEIRHTGYRQKRIERIVAEALEFELLPALEDPALQSLHVFKVEVRNLACIHVLLATDSVEQIKNAAAVEQALPHVENRLRHDLSGILRIKRMPLLKLSFLPFLTGSVPRSGGTEQGGGA